MPAFAVALALAVALVIAAMAIVFGYVEISDRAVTSSQITDGTVASDDIADGTIATADMADGSVTSTKLASGAVATVNLSGTAFHDTKLPLRKWLMAVLLMVEAKKGISANQMKRMLGVSYKTAWYLCHRIRATMKDANTRLLTGIVEADETYVGGRQIGVGMGNWRRGKTMVLGAVERGGEVRLKVDKRATKKIVHKFLESAVDDDAEKFYTDEHGAYEDFAERHEHVVHGKEEWVRGQVHTNTIESVWSLLDRSIIGSYHHLSARHLPAYLDEMAFRYNNRNNPYLFRDTLMKLIGAETLEYKELIAK